MKSTSLTREEPPLPRAPGTFRPAGTHLGALPLQGDACAFRVWAPDVETVALHIVHPDERLIPLERRHDGHHEGVLDECPPGTRYHYRLDGQADAEVPDPASRWQPEGVHGPSAVVAPYDGWTDHAWKGIPLDEAVIYELHVGTFTEAGTFDAVVDHLDELLDLGVTVVELMPVAQFPGDRNWGYDGVLPFAVQDSYGGPEGLARLVDACHARGMAVALDVVYNHLGPEGNILHRFGPYFTDRYRTPWGKAVNFDGRQSDEVRRYFIENALYWVTDLHIDMLRLDAVHAISDITAKPFLHELTESVHARAKSLRRHVHVVAESAANEPRLLRPAEVGGFGMDAQWSDDFHHALHAVLTRERQGYYADFGELDDLIKAFTTGFVFTGQHSTYRGRRHGAPPTGIGLDRFVVYAQNHDQTGNRFLGERLATLTDRETLKLAAGIVCLSPSIPLLFMGEEHAEERPFLYFTSHTDPALVEAVRQGRREEGRRFGWTGEAPDPQDLVTFARSRPDHSKRTHGYGRTLWRLHRLLLGLRRAVPALRPGTATLAAVRTDPADRFFYVERHSPPLANVPSAAFMIYNLAEDEVRAPVRIPPGAWTRAVDSAASEWDGPGARSPSRLSFSDADNDSEIVLAPRSFVVYQREEDGAGGTIGASSPALSGPSGDTVPSASGGEATPRRPHASEGGRTT